MGPGPVSPERPKQLSYWLEGPIWGRLSWGHRKKGDFEVGSQAAVGIGLGIITGSGLKGRTGKIKLADCQIEETS